jgi:hypothetical protein
MMRLGFTLFLLMSLAGCGRSETSLFGSWTSPTSHDVWTFRQDGTCESDFPTNFNGQTTGRLMGTCTYAPGKFDFTETSNNLGKPPYNQPTHYAYAYDDADQIQVSQTGSTKDTFKRN